MKHKLVSLPSKMDQSVNYIFDSGAEARYIEKDDYIIVYLSTHNGCNKACRFCHLTQTKQINMDEESVVAILDQARTVLEHYSAKTPYNERSRFPTVHFNFMARGEPLSSSVIRKSWSIIAISLETMAMCFGFENIRFNISTIMPEEVKHDVQDGYFSSINALSNIFGSVASRMPTIYYSLYSVNKGWRASWVPKAMNPSLALEFLKLYQTASKKDIVLHFPFIKGENDSEKSLDSIKNLVTSFDLKVRFNLIRYNPFSFRQGAESSEEVIQENFEFMKSFMTVRGSRIVPRVGFDVKASCGMFVSFNNPPITRELIVDPGEFTAASEQKPTH